MKRFPIILLLGMLVGSPGMLMRAQQSLVRFTENKNQWPQQIRYRAALDGGALFVENAALTYHFYDKDSYRKRHVRRANDTSPLDTSLRHHAFKIEFTGANATAIIRTEKPAADHANYFIGKDPDKWAGHVQHFGTLTYENIYEDIDLRLNGVANGLKYDFVVKPHADPDYIAMHYTGATRLKLSKGALQIETSLFTLTENKPYAYQLIDGKKTEVPCRFKLQNNTVSFEFPKSYNDAYELVIDPLLIFAASSGSLADNFGMTATYDKRGNLYSGGTCFDVGYPVTTGAYDETYNGIVAQGRTDVVITKFDSAGTYLHYATYLGGANGSEIVSSLVVDKDDNLWLYGTTGSNDFPITAGAYDNTFNGGQLLSFIYNGTRFSNGTDIYVAKLNPTGSTLMASTYIGGTDNDGVNHNNHLTLLGIGVYEYYIDSIQFNYGDQYRGEINVDTLGNCYIASSTRSANFPIVGGFDNILAGKQDAVAFKFNNNLSTLVWSTFLGGSDKDAGNAIALDANLDVLVTGGTCSNDFPNVGNGLYNAYRGGKADGFIAKIQNSTCTLMASTYIGTNNYDQCYFVQVDKTDNVYVYGQTLGQEQVTQNVYSNPNSGLFVKKLSPNLNSLLYSTVLGNGTTIPLSPSAFLVDCKENIYLSGWGGNILTGVPVNGMPLTINAAQPNTDGFNFYVMVLSSNVSNLLYASYFGGGQSQEHVDGGTSRFDKRGIIYQSVCAGCGGNDDFPVTPGAWPHSGSNVNHSTNCNNGVFKIDFQIALVQASYVKTFTAGCAPLTVSFTNQSSPGSHYTWNFGGNDTTSLILNPVRTFTAAGTYTVKLVVRDNNKCNITDSVSQVITVYPPFNGDFQFARSPCTNDVSFTDNSGGSLQWNWDFGDTQTASTQNPSHSYSSPGSYTVSLIAKNTTNCNDTIKKIIVIPQDAVSVNAATGVCQGNSVQLQATGGYSYSWTPASGLNQTNIPNPVASPTVTTTYSVVISYTNTAGDNCVKTLTTSVGVYNLAGISFTALASPDTILAGDNTVLSLSPSTSLNVNWMPSGNVQSPGSYTTNASPGQTTTYTVTVSDNNGCSVSKTVQVVVIEDGCFEKDIFVPNTFTPNGDGANDVLFVRGIKVRELYFAVYNRWGEKVFDTNDRNKGWDGIYKARQADPGVFGYYLKVTCWGGAQFEKKGNVTLIR